MLSDLQRQKLAHLFHVMDADGNGRMEAADLDRIARDLADKRGLDPQSERARALRASHEGMWREVQPFVRGDGLSLDGFIAYHERILPEPGAFESSIGTLSDLVFTTLDADDDGRITIDEQRKFFEAYGIDPDLADTVFPMWDTDENGFVSTAELAEVVRQFFYSADPDSPGNWLFGPMFSDTAVDTGETDPEGGA